MSRRVKARPRASQVEMGARTLREYQEVQRRAEKVLKEAAPRLPNKGTR